MAKATSLRRLGRLRGVQGDLAAKLELYSSARQVLEEAESLQTPEGRGCWIGDVDGLVIGVYMD